MPPFRPSQTLGTTNSGSTVVMQADLSSQPSLSRGSVKRKNLNIAINLDAPKMQKQSCNPYANQAPPIFAPPTLSKSSAAPPAAEEEKKKANLADLVSTFELDDIPGFDLGQEIPVPGMDENASDDQMGAPVLNANRPSPRQNETPTEFMERLPKSFTEPVDALIMRALYRANA